MQISNLFSEKLDYEFTVFKLRWLLDSLHLQLRLRIYSSATNKSIFTHLIQLQDPNICVVLTENLIYSLYVSTYQFDCRI